MSWEETNAQLIEAIRGRKDRRTLWGYGIRTADDYVRDVVDCVRLHSSSPPEWAGDATVKDAMVKLTYSNEETVADKFMAGGSSIETYCKEIKVEKPPHTLMVFENFVTTTKQDRDGDVMRTDGAMVDPNMPLLWHHMLPMPCGKMLRKLTHDKNHLKVATALVDSQLGQDSAVLVEFGALRISHGFRPFKAEPMAKSLDVESCPFPGMLITKFEIMEESLVTVPSNTDAVITAFSRKKLHDPAVKAWAQARYDERTKAFGAAVAEPVKSEAGAEVEGEQAKATPTTPADASVASKPFNNEHSARIADASRFERIARKSNEFGEGIDVLYGITSDSKAEVQSIRFDANKFTADEAKEWLAKHDYKPLEFAAAKKVEKGDVAGHEFHGNQYGGGSGTTQPGTENHILVRLATEHERKNSNARRIAMNAIEPKPGHVVVYKPYGNSGDKRDAGFYHVPEEEKKKVEKAVCDEKPSGGEHAVPLAEDEDDQEESSDAEGEDAKAVNLSAESSTAEVKAADSPKCEHVNADGTFKGGFDGCVNHFTECEGKSEEQAKGLCAKIARDTGQAPGGKSAEPDATKYGRIFNASNEKHLRSARDHADSCTKSIDLILGQLGEASSVTDVSQIGNALSNADIGEASSTPMQKMVLALSEAQPEHLHRIKAFHSLLGNWITRQEKAQFNQALRSMFNRGPQAGGQP